MISIICLYNDKGLLDQCLSSSLRNQGNAYELIALDNSRNAFSSAAAAFNYGATQARGEYLLFVHQDVSWQGEDFLARIEQMVSSLPNLGVAGVAGKAEGQSKTISNIYHGRPARAAGEVHISDPVEVQTVDECFFVVPKSVLNKVSFDAGSCAGYHLYAVDLCLTVRSFGYQVYVLPVDLYHHSTGLKDSSFFKKIVTGGVLPKEYYDTLERLIRKHKGHYKKIHTTCGDWDTSTPRVFQSLLNFLRNARK